MSRRRGAPPPTWPWITLGVWLLICAVVLVVQGVKR